MRKALSRKNRGEAVDSYLEQIRADFADIAPAMEEEDAKKSKEPNGIQLRPVVTAGLLWGRHRQSVVRCGRVYVRRSTLRGSNGSRCRR
jgi:hypothetical protein